MVAVLVSFAATRAIAQEPRQGTPPPPVLVDKVVATVNDSAILHSDLLTLTEAEIRGREATGKRVRAEDRQQIYEDELRKRIDRHTWAQAAKTFGYVPPEQVEAWFQRELEREEQNQVRDLGSYQAFSRALQDQGRTWPAFVREQRVEKLANFARSFSINMRMQQQANLYVTPRMMREAYEQLKPQLFVRDADAAVAMVTFTGPDAKENAGQAAALWRTEELSSRTLAERFPGATAPDTMNVKALPAELTKFALAGPVDRVSDPIEINGAFVVARIVQFVPARDSRFEDGEVQEDLRRVCERKVEAEFTKQALERARQRTEVWPARLGR